MDMEVTQQDGGGPLSKYFPPYSTQLDIFNLTTVSPRVTGSAGHFCSVNYSTVLIRGAYQRGKMTADENLFPPVDLAEIAS